MRISDWSSDVCSSDLDGQHTYVLEDGLAHAALDRLGAGAVGDGMGQDEVDAVARKDQAADARGGVHADGDGAEAGAQHRGQKAAVAGEDDPPRHDRLAGRKAAAHDGAVEVFRRSEEQTYEIT